MSKETYKKHPYLDIEVSDYGNVRTIDRIVKCKNGDRKYSGKVLSKCRQTTNKSNTYYYKVSISPEPGLYKHFWVHRLVAETWLPNPDGYKYVDHLDGDGCNNKIENLEWCDNSQNIKRAVFNGRYKNVHYTNGDSWSSISKKLGDKYGHIVYNRVKRGWCIKCATTIPKGGVGGDRTKKVCQH